MQSVSGFSPATQAVGLNARQSLANQNRNLFAGGRTDSFQSSQQAVKFTGLTRTVDKTYLDGADRREEVLSKRDPNSHFVPNPKSGRMHEADGAEYEHLKQIRNDRGLRDGEKIAAIQELFRQFFQPDSSKA